jgi:hypothetical protein
VIAKEAQIRIMVAGVELSELHTVENFTLRERELRVVPDPTPDTGFSVSFQCETKDGAFTWLWNAIRWRRRRQIRRIARARKQRRGWW